MLRGLAIVLIITHHLSRRLIEPEQLSLFYDLGHFGVGIFLCLSGFGLTESYLAKGIGGYFYPKTLRILLPFIFANILLIIFDKTAGANGIGLADMPFCLLGFIVYDANYWYMQFLFFLYFGFWIAFSIPTTPPYKLLVLLLFSILPLVSDAFPDSARFNSLTFFAGAAISVYKEQIANLINKKGWQILVILIMASVLLGFGTGILSGHPSSKRLVFVVALFVIFLLVWKSNYSFKEKCGLALFVSLGTGYLSLSPQLPVFYMTSISTCCWVITAFIGLGLALKSWKSPFWLFVGSISFELYLLHGMFMVNYDFVLHRFPLEYSYIAYLGIIILFAYAFKKLASAVSNRLDAALQRAEK